MNQEQAEVFSVQALGWLAGSDELLPVFLGATGASQDDLRNRLDEPEFLGSVLDFLMLNDHWVIACCDALGHPYDTPMQARQALPGGTQVNWT